MKDEPRYSEMLSELEGIVQALGRDECPVDELEEMVSRASVLLKALKKRLAATEESVSELLEELTEEI
ncbi:exodeoxyribonuclease VII small subunit [Candidatus Fermentibacteria bacterium]|nr:MAG: exodeoxyribonuclease VII small subunit [Candidatus Fermentibacteria bacterium]